MGKGQYMAIKARQSTTQYLSVGLAVYKIPVFMRKLSAHSSIDWKNAWKVSFVVSMVQCNHMFLLPATPPYRPEVSSPTDTSNFDADIGDDFTPVRLFILLFIWNLIFWVFWAPKIVQAIELCFQAGTMIPAWNLGLLGRKYMMN